MVLSSEELIKARKVKGQCTKVTSLLQLRESTHDFLIQCLADREIQKFIYEQGSLSAAYRYNCGIVHNPHNWSHIRR